MLKGICTAAGGRPVLVIRVVRVASSVEADGLYDLSDCVVGELEMSQSAAMRLRASSGVVCSAAQQISLDFHEDLHAECERCQSGVGQCLAERVLEAAPKRFTTGVRRVGRGL